MRLTATVSTPRVLSPSTTTGRPPVYVTHGAAFYSTARRMVTQCSFDALLIVKQSVAKVVHKAIQAHDGALDVGKPRGGRVRATQRNPYIRC